MDKLELFRTYIDICEEGSIVAAANKLGIDPSRVSQRLKAFEADVGVTLIQRSTRSMALTSAGSEYLAFGRDLLNRIDEFELDVRERDASSLGTLRISAPPFFSDQFLGAAILEISQLYPDLTCEIFATSQQMDLVKDGIHIAIRGGELSDSSLVGQNLYEGRFLLGATQGYIDAHGMPQTPEELADHVTLSFHGKRMHASWNMTKDGQSWTHRVSPKYTSNSLSTLLDMAQKGAGIIRYPDWALKGADMKVELQPILADFDHGVSRLSVVYPKTANKGSARTAAVKQLVHILKARLG